LDDLIAESRKWRRRRTIANNKLEHVFAGIEQFAEQMCERAMKGTDEKAG
jgi:hypothetical protein